MRRKSQSVCGLLSLLVRPNVHCPALPIGFGGGNGGGRSGGDRSFAGMFYTYLLIFIGLNLPCLHRLARLGCTVSTVEHRKSPDQVCLSLGPAQAADRFRERAAAPVQAEDDHLLGCFHMFSVIRRNICLPCMCAGSQLLHSIDGGRHRCIANRGSCRCAILQTHRFELRLSPHHAKSTRAPE